jgi:CheY-like chemotaxis protein
VSATSERPATASTTPAAPPPQDVASEKRDPARLVLVACPEQDAGKLIVSALSGWNLDSILVHDGVEAILNIQRSLPRAVVLDAALPKMFGFQICELMKRNECLRGIKVILMGAIHDQSRYRRPPKDLYGADAYTERHQLPEGLRVHLENFGLLTPFAGPPASRAAAEPAASAQTPEAVAPVAPPVSAAPVPAPPAATAQNAPPAAAASRAPTAPAAVAELAQSEAYEKAARLARIIVSDIVLYNQEEFDAAVRAGNVLEVLGPQLAEGYALFAERVDPSVGDAQEFLSQELLRIARSKGMNS